jgi:DNA-binding PadR family transcriptional regulator
MPPVLQLGEFEVLVVLAVLQLGDEAIGSRVRDEIERRVGREVSRGAVYVTLERLEEKGQLASRQLPGGPGRAGRPKRVFRVTTAGIKHVKHSIAAVARMHEGLEPLLGDL